MRVYLVHLYGVRYLQRFYRKYYVSKERNTEEKRVFKLLSETPFCLTVHSRNTISRLLSSKDLSFSLTEQLLARKIYSYPKKLSGHSILDKKFLRRVQPVVFQFRQTNTDCTNE